MSIQRFTGFALMAGGAFVVVGNALAGTLYATGGLRPTEEVPASTAITIASVNPLPSSVDLREWAVPAGDQGRVSSCTAWAVGYTLMGWYSKKANAPILFAPMYLYSQINGGESTGVDMGSRMTDAFKVALTQGVDTKSDYHQGDMDWQDQPTAAERSSAGVYKPTNSSGKVLFSHTGVVNNGAAEVMAVKQALAASVPVAIGLQVRPGFERVSSSNPLDNDFSGTVENLHVVIALGYDSDGLLVQNSWGPTWGLNGFGKISWNVFQHDVTEAIVVQNGFDRPVCSIVAPTRIVPYTGGPLSASAVCTGGAVSYSWSVNGVDFGNASSISGVAPTNNIKSAQSWEIHLTATNASGATSALTQLSIGQAAHP